MVSWLPSQETETPKHGSDLAFKKCDLAAEEGWAPSLTLASSCYEIDLWGCD